MNRSSTSRAQLPNAKVEIVAKTRNAIVAQIVIRWPTSTVTKVFLAAWLAGLSGMPATWSATAAATASTSAMIARKGRLDDFPLATAQRYRQARCSQTTIENIPNKHSRAFGPEAEQRSVEPRHPGPVLGRRGRPELTCIPVSGCLRVRAGRPVRSRHWMHALGHYVDVVEQCTAGTCLVPFRMPGRQEALVAPPDLHPPPVDRVPGRGGGELSKNSGADSAAGKHQLGQALCSDRIDELRHEPCRDRLGQ